MFRNDNSINLGFTYRPCPVFLCEFLVPSSTFPWSFPIPASGVFRFLSARPTLECWPVDESLSRPCGLDPIIGKRKTAKKKELKDV